MGWDEIELSWNDLKGEVKRQWSKLTDEDVELIKGKYAELLGLLQERYGHAKEQAEREINEWAKRLKVYSVAKLMALRDDVASLERIGWRTRAPAQKSPRRRRGPLPQTAAHRAKVEPLDHLHHEASQMLLRQPLVNRWRQQEPGLPINRAEVAHRQTFVTWPPWSSGKCPFRLC